MKISRSVIAICSVIALAGVLLPSFGGTVLAATSCECYCVAAKKELTSANTSGATYAAPGMMQSTEKTGPKADVGPAIGDDLEKAQKACAAKCIDPTQVAVPEGADYNRWDSCTQAGCWCKGKDGPYLKELNSQDGCKKTCTGLGQDFAGWGNTLPSAPGSSVGTKCPAGGIWTKDECDKAVNGDGIRIGLWDPPAGFKEGPYCFYNNTPVKLGVAIGGLTQASLAQYLAAAYRLGLGVAAVLAVIFIMVGGFRYMSAAGGSGIESAKEMIKNAVIGLVLAMLSYTLLQTVNPDILSLRLPRVNVVKGCTMVVDCGTRSDQKTCEDNSKDPTKRCVWSVKQAICYDNSINQADAQGQAGGECKKNASGQFECSSGVCIDIGANQYRCTMGDTCQACVNSTPMLNGQVDPNGKGGCQAKGGLPVMCIDNQCAQINPDNPPTASSFSKSNYRLCTNSKCSKDTDCASLKCGSNGTCITPNSGTNCTNDTDCNTRQGYKCTQIDPAVPASKKCCPNNGDANACAGCSSDGDCPKTKFCLDNKRYDLVNSDNPIDSSNKNKCVNPFKEGAVCSGNSMCESGQCLNGQCVGGAKVLSCDPQTTIKSLLDQGLVKNGDDYCQSPQGVGLGASYFCSDDRYWSYANKDNPHYGEKFTCVAKSGRGAKCCNSNECTNGCTREGTCNGSINDVPGTCK